MLYTIEVLYDTPMLRGGLLLEEFCNPHPKPYFEKHDVQPHGHSHGEDRPIQPKKSRNKTDMWSGDFPTILG